MTASPMWQQNNQLTSANQVIIFCKPVSFLLKTVIMPSYHNNYFFFLPSTRKFPIIVSGRTFLKFIFCIYLSISPSLQFLFFPNWILFLNSKCDLSQHNQRHWETEYCASQFVICWPSKLVPATTFFCKNSFLFDLIWIYLAFFFIFLKKI